MNDQLVLDFETKPILPRPEYPPAPVGLAYWDRATDKRGYIRWGHPTGNSGTEAQARELYQTAVDQQRTLCFQNAKFDMEVAHVHWDIPMPHWSLVEDTQYLIYLYDPHAPTLSLKPASERILNMPPDEQDAVKAWVLARWKDINFLKLRRDAWGAYIGNAPGDLVAPYAVGDVLRTGQMFDKLMPYIIENGMQASYDRERRLMPVLLRSERHGIRTDQERLEYDTDLFTGVMHDADTMLCNWLGGKFNPNSNVELADALSAAGMAEGGFLTTPTGKRSTSRASLTQAIRHKPLLELLAYRGALATALGTFMRPWALQAGRTGGRLHTIWHQTRNDSGKGTRTGRVSSSQPNFTNVPNPLDFNPPFGLPRIPILRDYLLPDVGHVWLKRDYSSQEVRILAHFEDGKLMVLYQGDPSLDPHQWASDFIRTTTGHVLNRGEVKIIAFSIIYGAGAPHLSSQLNCEKHQAYALKALYLNAMPDVKVLMEDIKARGKQGMAVRTIGSRLIYAEDPVDGRDFAYKLLNHLIQGSAADATKEALVRWDDETEESVMMAQVYDEINISAPFDVAEQEMLILRDSMEGVEMDVRLLSEGFRGASWADADRNKVDTLKQRKLDGIL